MSERSVACDAGRLLGVDDGFDAGLAFQIPETSLHRSILDLRESVARFRYGAFEVSVGKQIFAWGTAEGFNPVDNLNSWDYGVSAPGLPVAADRARRGDRRRES